MPISSLLVYRFRSRADLELEVVAGLSRVKRDHQIVEKLERYRRECEQMDRCHL
jgi:hypothetical protein